MHNYKYIEHKTYTSQTENTKHKQEKRNSFLTNIYNKKAFHTSPILSVIIK